MTDPEFSSPVDGAVRFLPSVFVDMKFSLLFSFLFGYGFTLQMGAAARVGAGFRARMWRRIAGLYAAVLVSLVASGPLVDRSRFLPSEGEARANAERATQALLGGWGMSSASTWPGCRCWWSRP
ncbi:hypothetical protein ACFVH6_02295 [Spirillospora sp. NPDC127200]